MLPVLSIIKKAIGITKKIFLVIAVYFIVINIFLYSINKESRVNQSKENYLENNRLQLYQILYDKKLNSTKEGKISLAVYQTLTCTMVGETCTNNPNDAENNYDKSVLGLMTNLITLPYKNPPASGIYWAYTGLQNAGFIPKTYAAGIGFNSLTVFMPIWNALRKISYLILVLVMITIGFMIMFRMKLNPQTVIAVENALPKIVITLLLITFSYAIVGFIIDLMYLFILIGIEILSKPLGLDAVFYQNDILTSNLFDYVFTLQNMGLYSKALLNLFLFLPKLIQGILILTWGVVSFLIGARFVPAIGNIISGLLGDITAGVVVADINLGRLIGYALAILLVIVVAPLLLLLILLLIVPFTILFLCFKILFLLLSSLIQIILYLIFAPFFILLEAIPGRSSFTAWFKNIIGNTIVFPAVIFLIVIVNGINNLYLGNQVVFTPPFLSGWSSQAILPMINAVMLLMIPDLVKALKQSIIGKEGLQLPIGPGALFGAAGATMGTVTSGAQQIYYLSTAKTALLGQKDASGKTQGGMISGLMGSLTGGLKNLKP